MNNVNKSKIGWRRSIVLGVVAILFPLVLFAVISQTSTPRTALATPMSQFTRTFTTINAPGLVQELSGSVESITVKDGAWVITAGGVPASTHYARLRYKLPEQEGISPTTFYMKSVVILPPDFYTRQTAGFRILNTDNFGITVNGVHYGASNTDEFRTGVWFYTDHTLRVRTAQDSGAGARVIYTLPYRLPTGKHTIEFYGDVASVAPWYLKIDGIVVASGNARLSPDTVPPAERVITRLAAGIMGAAELDDNSATYKILEFAVANYDVSPQQPSPPTPTLTPTVTATPTMLCIKINPTISINGMGRDTICFAK